MSRFATDLLRVIAVSCIVFNHATWDGFVQVGTEQATAYSWFYAVVNQLGKPSTIFFLFLSGFAFGAHRRFGGSEFRADEFYRNRTLRILPVYLLFSTIGFILVSARKRTFDLLNYVTGIFEGSHMFHLYFVAMLCYLYAAFPLLARLRYSPLRAALLAVPAIFVYFFVDPQVVIALPFGEQFRQELRQTLAGRPTYWIILFSYAVPFFMYGIWSGRAARASREAGVAPAPNRLLFLIWTALLPVGFLLVFQDFYNQAVHGGVFADFAGRIWRPVVALYALIWIAWIGQIRERDGGPLLRHLARASFLVYISHPLLMITFSVVPYPWRAPVVLALSWPLALGLMGLARLHPALAVLVGEGDREFKKGPVAAPGAQPKDGRSNPVAT
jgi:surface polysaccharide O-acyltransferase-like enzyme